MIRHRSGSIVCALHWGLSAPWAVAQVAPLHPEPVNEPCQLARFVAEDGAYQDIYGMAVGVADGLIVIGAANHFHDGLQGTAYVYERDADNAFRLTQQLDFAGPGSSFGRSVAVESSRIVVGGLFTAAVYVYERTDAAWVGVAMLPGEDPIGEDWFGASVALVGDIVVVGAQLDSQAAFRAGAAYVFQQSEGEWEQTAKLLASDAQIVDKFGSSVAIADDVIVVGATDADPLGFASGAAYIFERDRGGAWVETAKLVPSDGSPLDLFGRSVTVDGGVVIVGAISADGDAPTEGAAYVFERDDVGQWTETAIIKADDAALADSFGSAVALVGESLIVGARAVDGSGPGAAGAAYLFRRQPDGSWLQTVKIQPDDLGNYDEFGRAVALTEEMAVIGAPLADVHATDSGAAYVYAIGGDANGNGVPDLCECRGDIDDSGVVDQPDLGRLLASFTLPVDHPLYDPAADLDGDDDVDLTDLTILLDDYGSACPRR